MTEEQEQGTAAPTPNVAARFGLRRDNFILDPVEDTECFGRRDIDTRSIAEGLETDLVTSLAPKRLIWGPYGGGKTHTLMRTMEELKTLTPIHAVRVECPDLAKKSRFHDLYREGIMRELGQDFVLSLIGDVLSSVGTARREELQAKLKEKFGDEEVSKGAIRLVDPGFEELTLWRWISGVSLSRADLDNLRQTHDLTDTEAARLADIIILFGRLLKEIRGERLVLVLDEMERLKSIGAETIGTFVSGFTRLADPNQKHVSILMGASAAVEDELVEVFSPEGPVVSRLGPDAQIEIPALPDQDVDRFISDVIKYIRDSSADVDALVSQAGSATQETVEKDLYPFTREAVESIKSQLRQMMTPREITHRMTRALGRAYKANQPIITSTSVA